MRGNSVRVFRAVCLAVAAPDDAPWRCVPAVFCEAVVADDCPDDVFMPACDSLRPVVAGVCD